MGCVPSGNWGQARGPAPTNPFAAKTAQFGLPAVRFPPPGINPWLSQKLPSLLPTATLRAKHFPNSGELLSYLNSFNPRSQPLAGKEKLEAQALDELSYLNFR